MKLLLITKCDEHIAFVRSAPNCNSGFPRRLQLDDDICKDLPGNNTRRDGSGDWNKSNVRMQAFCNNKKLAKLSKGTTLIEVLLYTILVASFIVLVTSYASNISSGKVKNDATAEVNDNAQIATFKITSAVRNAKNLVTPENQGEISSTLIVTNSKDQRITFDLSGGRLRMAENDGAPIEITSAKVEVSNLVFSNLTRPGTEGNIRVQMQISRVNPTNNPDFAATSEIDFATSLRPN